MTREEAIKRIENLIRGRKDKRGKTELDFALDMAIEALKREKRALQLKSIVRNIDGWQNIVNEVARLEAEERGESE